MAQIVADGVGVLIFRRGGDGIEFLQLHRAESKDYYQQQSWQICYGGIRDAETAPQAALREMNEETGLTPLRFFQVEYVEAFYFRPRDAVVMMPVFAAEVPADATPTLNEEHDRHRWVSEGQIDHHFVWRTQREAVRILIDQIRNPGSTEPFLNIAL